MREGPAARLLRATKPTPMRRWGMHMRACVAQLPLVELALLLLMMMMTTLAHAREQGGRRTHTGPRGQRKMGVRMHAITEPQFAASEHGGQQAFQKGGGRSAVGACGPTLCLCHCRGALHVPCCKQAVTVDHSSARLQGLLSPCAMRVHAGGGVGVSLQRLPLLPLLRNVQCA